MVGGLGPEFNEALLFRSGISLIYYRAHIYFCSFIPLSVTPFGIFIMDPDVLIFVAHLLLFPSPA